MRPDSRGYLADARDAAKEIIKIAGPSGEAYIDNRRDALAIERLFEVIGEAMIRIRSAEPTLLERINDAAAIIGMRNVIAHGYDAIDPLRVAETIRIRVPELIADLVGLLDGS
jgi:uncharacterized protein with HEPN domain